MQGIYKVHGRLIRGTCRVHTGYIQGIYRAYTGYIQGIYKVYTGYIQDLSTDYKSSNWVENKSLGRSRPPEFKQKIVNIHEHS